MQKDSNFFDDLIVTHSGEALRQQTDREEKGKRIDYLIHKVFRQYQEGQELLEIWRDTLIMQPTADEGIDQIGIGIREGQKRMIRGIILTINRVGNE